MSVVNEQPCISVITLLRGEKEFIPLIKANFQEFNYPKDKLDLIIIDDGKESLLDEFQLQELDSRGNQVFAWHEHYEFDSYILIIPYQ